MTETECQSCTKPTKTCQDIQFAHLIRCECWNYTPVAAGEVPWMQTKLAPFEQIAIESHDTDQIETLYHMDGCGCPACLRMVRRGYVKDRYAWRMKNESTRTPHYKCEA